MSTTNQDGSKTILPRTGPDHFWKTIHNEYAGEDQRKWKYLAMLALRENAGWPLEYIGTVFGHPQGHVTRCLQKIKTELQSRFRMSPDLLELEEARGIVPALDSALFDLYDTNDDGALNVAELLAAVGRNAVVHSADTNGDSVIGLIELIRVIQFYNGGGYSCLALPGDSEDGYDLGDYSVEACPVPHAADYNGGPNGVIDLSELLRMIQFYSIGGYDYCPDGTNEDGFCGTNIP